jgi:hypothetical protein
MYRQTRRWSQEWAKRSISLETVREGVPFVLRKRTQGDDLYGIGKYMLFEEVHVHRFMHRQMLVDELLERIGPAEIDGC